MNYYKLSFNKIDSEAFRLFQMAVQLKYGRDLWGPCETSFVIFATTDEPATVMKNVDVSVDRATSKMAGAGSLNLSLSEVTPDEATLPDEARAWLLKTMQAVASIHELLSKHERFKS